MKTISQSKTYAIFSGTANRRLIETLENDGAKVFQFAPLRTQKIESDTSFEEFAYALTGFEWIIFPDIYAVDYFLEALNELEIDLFELDALRVLAYGEAVADRLRFVQLHADIITVSEEANLVFSTLSRYIGESELAVTSFFIPTGAEYDLDIKDSLIESGAKVESLPVYKIIAVEKREISKLKTLLKGGAIDEFIFTSPEDVFCIKYYARPEVLPDMLTETITSGTSEITIRTLIENKLSATKSYHKKRG